MKIKNLLTCLVLLTPPASADTIHGEIVGVSDGDTVTVLDHDNVSTKVRLSGIDAPEKRQPHGEKSRQSLAEMVFGKKVDVQWQKKDRYGRVVGKILVDRNDINVLQIHRGMAWHYKKYATEQPPEDRETYANAEYLARQKGVGLWGDDAPVPPWEFRRKR